MLVYGRGGGSQNRHLLGKQERPLQEAPASHPAPGVCFQRDREDGRFPLKSGEVP